MKIVLQRVSRAEVRVSGQPIGSIRAGILLLVCIETGDRAERLDAIADRVLELRIFGDGQGKMNLSCRQIKGEILVVPQFTLAASLQKGRRPSFVNAAPPREAKPLFLRFVEGVRGSGLRVETGRFGALMEVELVNDGPVTFIL